MKPTASFNTVRRRIQYGWSNEEAYELIEHNGDHKNKTVVNGVSYGSQQEAYNALKPIASPRTVRKRIQRGWSTEEAFELVDRLM